MSYLHCLLSFPFTSQPCSGAPHRLEEKISPPNTFHRLGRNLCAVEAPLSGPFSFSQQRGAPGTDKPCSQPFLLSCQCGAFRAFPSCSLATAITLGGKQMHNQWSFPLLTLAFKGNFWLMQWLETPRSDTELASQGTPSPKRSLESRTASFCCATNECSPTTRATLTPTFTFHRNRKLFTKELKKKKKKKRWSPDT